MATLGHMDVHRPSFEATMVTSFFQKPIGAITLLGTAIGAPYAIFETEAGTSARVTVQKLIGTSTSIASGALSEWNSSSPTGVPGSTASTIVAPTITTDPNFSSASYPSGTVVTPVGPPIMVNGAGVAGTGNAVSNGSMVSYGQQIGQPTTQGVPIPFGSGGTASAITSPQAPATVMQGAAFGGSPANSPPTAVMSWNMPPPAASNVSAAMNPAALSGYSSQPIMAQPTMASPTMAGAAPGSASGVQNISDFREVLRFDIGPSFVTSRFQRITTVASSTQFDVLRVPFVSGTRPSDITGSLTYFFDAHQTVQRIQLQGTTGDPAVLTQLMVSYYHLKPETSLGGQMFTTRWNTRVTSMLLVGLAPVIYADSNYGKFSVFLELNQPSHQYGLSDEANQILMRSQATSR